MVFSANQTAFLAWALKALRRDRGRQSTGKRV